ncbi:MAG: ribose-5-phosphate isomerase RpiA [Saprospiraceae bacterium]|nr:ribose-5-phosphate isomerase RpiA [Saprospiraceae bacterium]
MNAKQVAAEKAVGYIENGMLVGLGTGSTAFFAIKKIGDRVKEEGLKITAVASSSGSEELARSVGIPLVPLSEIESIDLYIDGADEVDKNHHLIKGGGAAHLREKILASNSRKFIVIIDDSKFVETLGNFPLPVEITPFASNLTLNKLAQLGCKSKIRMVNKEMLITDNGNYIVDCLFGKIHDPEALDTTIHSIPGVVETGIFPNSMVHGVIIGYESGKIVEAFSKV